MTANNLIRAGELTSRQVALLIDLTPARAEMMRAALTESMSHGDPKEIITGLQDYMKAGTENFQNLYQAAHDEIGKLIEELGGEAAELKPSLVQMTIPGNVDEIIRESHKVTARAVGELMSMSDPTAEALDDLRQRTIRDRIADFIASQEANRMKAASIPAALAAGADQMDQTEAAMSAGLISLSTLAMGRATFSQMTSLGLDVPESIRTAAAEISNELVDLVNDTLLTVEGNPFDLSALKHKSEPEPDDSPEPN